MPVFPQNPKLLYVTDPMCAWCYGFTPVIRRLQALWRGRLSVEVVVGGLHPYATEPLLNEEKERLAVSWHLVQERTGLPFDYSFFLRQNFVYDTEPACRTLLAVRHLRPVLVLEVLRALHSAFYAEGRDIADPEELIRITGMFGIPENLFLTLYEAEEIKRQTEEEFQFAERIGATSLPSLYLQEAYGPELIARGYCDLDELEGRLIERLELHNS